VVIAARQFEESKKKQAGPAAPKHPEAKHKPAK